MRDGTKDKRTHIPGIVVTRGGDQEAQEVGSIIEETVLLSFMHVDIDHGTTITKVLEDGALLPLPPLQTAARNEFRL